MMDPDSISSICAVPLASDFKVTEFAVLNEPDTRFKIPKILCVPDAIETPALLSIVNICQSVLPKMLLLVEFLPSKVVESSDE